MQTSARYSERQLKQAVTWFVQLQAESCSEQDQQLFQIWLAKDSAHQAAYNAAERLWGNFDTLKSLGDIPALRQARTAKPAKSPVISVALSLLIASVLTVASLEYSAETLNYSTQRGKRQHFVLSDNSEVDLNTNTHIQVKISPLHRQIQLLHGEALFAVQHQFWRDFTVQAESLQIRDIGTRFNVRLNPETVAVSVLEGEVELQDEKSQGKQNLLAGSQTVYRKNSGLSQPAAVNPKAVTAWLDGNLVFDRTPLSQVVAELERYHDVKFVFATPDLRQETLSGSFDAADLEPFLHTIKPMLAIQAKRQGKVIRLQRGKR